MERVTITGRVAAGAGEGAFFTGLAWARDQFRSGFAIDPHPGTFNLTVDSARDRAVWDRIRAGPGERLASPEPAWCDARCYRVRLPGGTDGVIVVPEVDGYPADRMEVVAGIALRERLAVADGDPVTVEVTVSP